MSSLTELFKKADHPLPLALAEWENNIDKWCQDYYNDYPDTDMSEINLDLAVFIFDHIFERVILAYALSAEPLTKRDANRMRGFPDVNLSIRNVVGENTFKADKGHFLGHASGGTLDINLFPQRRELNRGWSSEGKRFRKMERYVAQHPGVFFYHRAIYNDDSWIPKSLEYGVLCKDENWWIDTFMNK